MSNHLTSLVWEIKFPTQAQKLILLRLADYANDDGHSIFPAVENIAQHAGCTRRCAQYVLVGLRKAGLLVLHHQGGSGPKDTNKWQIDVPLLCQLALKQKVLEGSRDSLQAVDNKGEQIAPLADIRVNAAVLRVNGGSFKGEPPFTRTSINHQLEPKARKCAKDLNLDVEEKKSLPPARPATRVTKSSIGWTAWLDHLRKTGNDEFATEAENLGEMIAESRWPKSTSSLPRLPKQPSLTEQTKRMTGETNHDPERGAA